MKENICLVLALVCLVAALPTAALTGSWGKTGLCVGLMVLFAVLSSIFRRR